MTKIGTRFEPHFGGAADAPAIRNAATVVSSSAAVSDFFGVDTMPAGRAVTETSTMRIAAAYSCVRIIAGAIASLPLDFYRRDVEKGTAEKINAKDSLWWLFNEEPGPRWTAAAFWKYAIQSELLRGDGLAYIVRDRNGEARSLEPMSADRTTIELNPEGLRYYWTDDFGRRRGAYQDDVLHFPGFGFDGKRGKSAIQWGARNSVGTAIALEEFAATFFGSGALQKMVIKAPGTMTDDQIRDFKNAWATNAAGLNNAYRPPILTEGLDVKELQLSAEDSQVLESRKFQVVDIARAFGVPPFMIGESEKTSSWGSGVEAMSLGFVKYTLGERLVSMEQEINRKIFRTASRFVKFGLDDLLRGDSAARSKFLRELVGGSSGPGVITINEARRSEGFPPIDGGDALYSPNSSNGAPANAP